MSTFFENVDARPVLAPTSAANLRTEPSAKFIAGLMAVVPVGPVVDEFSWDTTSLAVDDGVYVIKPNDIIPANPGRFLRIPGDIGTTPISRTLFVDGGYGGVVANGAINTPYKTIQAAIAAVPAVTDPNGVEVWQILVAPRAYNESLSVPTNRQIILAPWKAPRTIFTAVQLGSPAITGDVTWVISGGVAGATLLSIQNFFIDQFFVDATVAPASTCTLEFANHIGNTVAMSAGAFPASGSVYLERAQFFGAFSLPTAQVTSRESVVGALTLAGLTDTRSLFSGAITCATAGVRVMKFFGSDFTGGASFVNANSDIEFDDVAARNAARSGVLNTPVTGTANSWRGASSDYYSLHHTVRYSTAAVAANIGDEYIAMDPAAATTITLTLPAANLFAALANETNGAVARRPTRHLVVKNVAAAGDTGVVDFAVTGTDDIDRAAASGFVLLAGEVCYLVPVLIGAVFSWMPLHRFGRNYLSAVSAALSASTSAVFATKVSLTTPALRGIYAIRWHAIVSATNANTDIQARLFDVTGAVQLGQTNSIDVSSTTELVEVSGVAYLTLAGAARTVRIEWARPAGTGNANIEDAVLEMWRVQ